LAIWKHFSINQSKLTEATMVKVVTTKANVTRFTYNYKNFEQKFI